jgi:hypothetical protein
VEAAGIDKRSVALRALQRFYGMPLVDELERHFVTSPAAAAWELFQAAARDVPATGSS